MMNLDTFFNEKILEFFVKPGTREVFIIKKNKPLVAFSDISIDDATILRRDMERYPQKIETLEKAGITDPMKQLEEYAACMFGAITNDPDFVGFKRRNFTISPCLMRGTGRCKYAEQICDKGKLVLENGTVITRAELKITSSTMNGLSEKEIAESLGISVNTVRKQRAILREKLNLKTSCALATFGVRHAIA